MLRLLQVIVALLIIPMMCLGMMSGLSGGGLNPSYQRIGQVLLVLSPLAGIAAVVVSFILQRLELSFPAYAAVAAPLVMWFVLMAWLQRETGFFF